MASPFTTAWHRLALPLVAFVLAAPPALAEGNAATAAAAAGPAAAEVAARLFAHVVTDADYARGTFYTWTSPQQIAALRSSKTLLVATATSGGRPSPFLRRLAELVEKKAPGWKLAELLLSHPKLERRRYAWTSPFATVLGLGERSYGTTLIKVDLRPEAIIARFAPDSGLPFSFVDQRGQAVAEAEVLAAPERLGAIYHVRTRGPSDFVPFREYILCNEGMVASFAAATPEIRARLDEEARLLRDLQPAFAALPPRLANQSAVAGWAKISADAPLLVRWWGAMPFDNRKYRPQPKNLEKILAALAAYDPAGEPLTHSPATGTPTSLPGR